MVSREALVKNAAGIHARPSLALVNTAKRFKSKIELRIDSGAADAKEILQVMTLGAQHGTVITVSAAGPDEEEAVGSIVDLFDRCFDMPGD